MKDRSVLIRYADLAVYFSETGDRQEDFAARVGVRQGYISKLVRGHFVPREPLKSRIARAAAIPVESFDLLKLRRKSRQIKTAIVGLSRICQDAVSA